MVFHICLWLDLLLTEMLQGFVKCRLLAYTDWNLIDEPFHIKCVTFLYQNIIDASEKILAHKKALWLFISAFAGKAKKPVCKLVTNPQIIDREPVDEINLNRPLRKMLQYSLFVPPNFAEALFPVSLGTYNGPLRKQKRCLCKIWGDKRTVLSYFLIFSIECFHSRDQWAYFSTKTKENVCIGTEFNSQRIGWGQQHGRRSFVQGHQHGRRDVTWKKTLLRYVQKCA